MADKFLNALRLKQIVSKWRSLTAMSGMENRYSRVYYKRLANSKFKYDNIIDELKKKILHTESQITIIDGTYQECAYNLSQSLMRAMHTLNKEVLDINTYGINEQKTDRLENAQTQIKKLENMYFNSADTT